MNADQSLKNQSIKATGDHYRKSWDRLFSVLGSSKPGKAVNEQKVNVCHQLSQLPAGEREAFVDKMWGRVALDKVRPMLEQIKALEEQAARM